MDQLEYREDRNIIKVWPCLDDLSSVNVTYRDNYLTKDPNRIINIDFSQVKRFNSSSGAIALFNLCKALKGKNHIYRIVMPEDAEIKRLMQNSSFFRILADEMKIDLDLFQEICQTPEGIVDFDNRRNIRTTSPPIYVIRYDKSNERKGYEVFSKWLLTTLHPLLFRKYDLDVVSLIEMINEIAKNTQDHAKTDAFFGLDIVEYLDSKTGELRFSCFDFGKGIHRTIVEYIKTHPQEGMRRDAWKNFSVTDSYERAFEQGFSTSDDTKRNKGMGLSMIITCSAELGLDLSICDSQVRFQVPYANKFSHAKSRQMTFSLHKPVGFYYYGRLKF